MPLPPLQAPVRRDGHWRHAVPALGASPGASDVCGDCTATCQKFYSNDKARYSACCETCSSISKVCWYSCCSKGPGCSVPP